MRNRASIWSVLICALGMVGGACGGGAVEQISLRKEAITYGTLDGDAHPAVVLLLMEVDGKVKNATKCFSFTFYA